MDVQTINKRLVSGFFSLTFRRVAFYVLRVITINFILAPFLGPAITGVYNLANSILAFFTFFSDIGLAAAIIQKKNIDERDLKTTFTVQQLLALTITLLVWFLAPSITKVYSLENSFLWLIRALGIAFFLISFKVLPAVLLERELKFTTLVLIETGETVVFCGSLIFLSFNGLGIDSFSYSTILQSLTGVILIYIISPWKVRIGISKSAIKSLFSFGIPFQFNSLLALLKDRVVPLVVAKIIGSTALGYVTWAQTLAFIPLEVMNIIIRVTFPAYSRLQHDSSELKKVVERSIFLTTLFLYPLLFGLLAITPSIVTHIFRTDWRPALPLIYIFAINTFWASLSTTFTNLLNAIGKIKTTLKLMIMWTLLTWILTPILTIKFGYFGVAFASAIISFSSIIPIIIIKRLLDIEIIKNIWQPLICSILMFIIIFFLANSYVTNFINLLIIIGIGGVIYFCLIYLLAKKRTLDILSDFKLFKSN